jgi:hypothetical protein
MISPSSALVIRHSPSTCSSVNSRRNTSASPTAKTPRLSTVPMRFADTATEPATVVTVA